MSAPVSLNRSNVSVGSSVASWCLQNTCLTGRLRLLSPIPLIANMLLQFGVWDVLNGTSVMGDVPVHDGKLKDNSHK